MKHFFLSKKKNIKIFLKHLNNNLEYYGPNCYENRSYPRFRRNIKIFVIILIEKKLFCTL